MNAKIASAALVGLVSLASSSMSFADSDDIIVQRYTIKIEKHQTFMDKTIQEAGSTEGKALIGAVASYFGVPSTVVGLTLAAIRPDRQAGSDYWRSIPSPPGYTICYAKPTGAQYNGVETSQDSTFNAVIRRQPDFDGLAMYLAVPLKTVTTRAMSTFDVAFVRNPPGWQKYPQCRPTSEAAWLSRNNNTRLNVPTGQY